MGTRRMKHKPGIYFTLNSLIMFIIYPNGNVEYWHRKNYWATASKFHGNLFKLVCGPIKILEL